MIVKKRISIKLIDSLYCIEHDDILAECYHHIIPASLGGTLVVPLCSECHSLIHHGHDRSWIDHGNLVRKGLQKSKDKGIVLGRKKTRDDDAIWKLHNEGFTMSKIAKTLSISKTTVHRSLNSRSEYLGRRYDRN